MSAAYKKCLLFLILFIIVSVSDLWAYPISPRPLRKLVMESKNIIIGFVVQTYDRKTEKYDWDNKVARIKVLEKLQGNISEDSIEIAFSPDMMCPDPDRYYDNTLVISFFNEKEKDGKYRTHALSYGAKTLDQNSINVYKQRIQELQRIMPIANEEGQYLELVEWLVKCAEHPATRWEGVFELSPESDFMSAYSRDKEKFKKFEINKNQKDRLLKSLLDRGELSYNDFGLVDLVYKGNEAAINSLLIKSLKALPEQDYFYAYNFLKRLHDSRKSYKTFKLIEEYEEIRFDYSKEARIKEIVAQFIKELEKKPGISNSL